MRGQRYIWQHPVRQVSSGSQVPRSVTSDAQASSPHPLKRRLHPAAKATAAGVDKCVAKGVI